MPIVSEIERKLTKNGNSTGLIVPQLFLEMLGWKRGDRVQLRIEGEDLIVTRANHSDAKKTHKK